MPPSAQVTFDDVTIALVAGQVVTFGRGGDKHVDLQLPSVRSMSRVAGRLELLKDGIRVSSEQLTQSGHIAVLLPSGDSVAWLTRGASYELRDPTFLIRLRLITTPPYAFDLAVRQVPVGRSRPEDPAATDHSFRTTDGGLDLDQDWGAVAALICVLSTPSGAPKFDTLKRACAVVAGQERVSSRWLSSRLDEVLDHLGLAHDGRDKIPRIAATLMSGRLVSEAELQRFRKLARR